MVSQQRQQDLEPVRARLTEWVRSRMPDARDVSLSELTRPGLGFSNETLLGELSWRENGQRRSENLVFRLEPSGFRVFPEYDLPKQVRIMQSLDGTPVPVPEVPWLEEDKAVLGCPFYVMKRIEGDVPPDVPLYHMSGVCFDATPERRAKMWWSGVETLANIHLVDWRGLGMSFLGVPGGGTGPIDDQLDYYERFLQWVKGEGDQHPILEASLQWLRENRYEPKRVTLCWGDARLPNMIYRDDRVVAVLDWEMAFLGDPEADLGWWLFLDWHHSEGAGIARLDGFAGREDTVRRYEELTGCKAENLLYNEVMAAFRFGVIMASFYRNMKVLGIPSPTPDAATNSATTRRLAALLNLPPPG